MIFWAGCDERENRLNRIEEDVAELIATLVCNIFTIGENLATDGGMTMRIA